MANPLIEESQNIWLDKWRFDDAEKKFHLQILGGDASDSVAEQESAEHKQAITPTSSLVSEIAKARQQIQKSLHHTDASHNATDNVLTNRLENLELENSELRKVTQSLQAAVKKLESRISALECSEKTSEKAVTKQEEKGESEEDDDIDLFGSDEEEDDEAEKLKQERLQAYHAKKSDKPKVIAKSNVILDVKPWDDTTDMAIIEKCVRSIEMDGLLWGSSRLVPVGYGIKKLTISCVVVDDKVSIDDLEEQIVANEDYIQSVDIAAFNKI